MLKVTTVIALGFASAMLVATSASALTVAPTVDTDSSIQRVADGCGPGGWRGRWGACHYRHQANGCAPGSWRGPWGHCRNTPYHGRLPNGGWR